MLSEMPLVKMLLWIKNCVTGVRKLVKCIYGGGPNGASGTIAAGANGTNPALPRARRRGGSRRAGGGIDRGSGSIAVLQCQRNHLILEAFRDLTMATV